MDCFGLQRLAQLGCHARFERSAKCVVPSAARRQHAKADHRTALHFIRHADGSCFHQRGVAHKCGLHLRRADAFACHIYRIVRAPQNLPLPVCSLQCPIAMHPNIRPARPIGFKVALAVAPKAARHSNPRRTDGQLAHFAAHRLAAGVQHNRVNTGACARERARLERRDWVAHQNATADFCAARIVDDGNAALANNFK